MRLGIMQPYFFPYIGYFQLINAVDKFIVYENLNYIKEGWMHRNRVKIKKGQWSYIIVKLNKKSSNKKISEIFLDDSTKWRDKILKMISRNYKSSKYFDEIFPFVEKLILSNRMNLHKYNFYIIKEISKYLNMDTDIVGDNSQYLILEKKLKNNSWQSSERKIIRAVEICKNEKADIFINPIGGVDMYPKERFKKHNIKVFFIKTGDVKYNQFDEEFIANLSIIDVLMHNGREGTIDFLNHCTLI